MADIDLKSYIESALKDIREGSSKEFTIQGPIEFELSTITSKNKEGKIDIKVLELGSDVNVQNIQKLKFQVYNKEDLNLRKTLAETQLIRDENSRRCSVGYRPGPIK